MLRLDCREAFGLPRTYVRWEKQGDPGGYLPEAIRNYLARLSWSHGDDEIFSTEQVRLRWNPTEHLGSPIFFHGTNLFF